MIAGIAKTVVAVYVVYKIYKKLERLMLSDEKYLSKISNQDGELISKTIEEARRHARDKEYDLATEYFYYAHKLLGCSWDFIVSQADSEEVRELLHLKRASQSAKDVY